MFPSGCTGSNPVLGVMDSNVQRTGNSLSPRFSRSFRNPVLGVMDSNVQIRNQKKMEKPVFIIDGLEKRLNGRNVLRGIDLKINHGEKLCIVGLSGCGKTTLVKHLNGLTKQDSGNVFFHDKDLRNLTEEELGNIRLRMGYVFQHNAVFSGYSVYDNVASGLREGFGFSSREDDSEEIQIRVRESLKLVGLDYNEDSNKMPNELSGGMAKRVAIARTIAYNPEVIIYDEPTAGLDPNTSTRIGRLIDKIHDVNGSTNIVVTHDRDIMKIVNDRIVMLRMGKIYYDGNFEDFNNSRDINIRTFLSRPLARESERVKIG
jgi:phospholipid/cholesterol/gamma-HCH transport system ATP-binding protein